ncbi:copper transporter [soil metagenome]
MITFRYHVVTLVAVFMAIGLGVLFGATFIDQNIVDSLRATQARLGDRNEALRDRIGNLEDENEALQTFTRSTRDIVVRGALTDVPVVLVAFESTPGDALDAVRETLALAGARTEGQLTLSDRLDLRSAENRQRLATALNSSSTDAASLSEELIAQLGTAVSGQNPEFLTRLLQAALASAPIALTPTVSDPPPAVVMVGGGLSREVNDRIAVPLARLLGSGPTVAAVAESGIDLQTLKPLRDDSGLRIMTVDSIETALGQSALAVGLQGALTGRYGHYGRGEGATTALPEFDGG